MECIVSRINYHNTSIFKKGFLTTDGARDWILFLISDSAASSF